MSTEKPKRTKGRLAWVIDVLEIIIAIAYVVIGYEGWLNAFQNFDFAGMFESVRSAMIFLIVATAILSLLCFIPVFKSKGNTKLAIVNVIWIILTITSL